VSSVGDQLPIELERARGLFDIYKEIGAAGAFGAIIIGDAISRANRAVASGDAIEMIRAWNELRGLK
jgi:hypothetical protein